MLDAHGHGYPSQTIKVIPFMAELSKLFHRPEGLIEDPWPPPQLVYLGQYLDRLGCKTVVIESHYIDRDYLNDFALFHARSLRGYPHFCQRMHFFDTPFDSDHFRNLVHQGNAGKRKESQEYLQQGYLGYSVVRPLPGTPVGRTVLATLGATTAAGRKREFGAVRTYASHLAGFRLEIQGLAFQQQDQAVSACATTALWTSFHRVAPMEGLTLQTPAEVTEAASRYFLADGRALPSEGLTIDQISEAIRAAGLSPLVISSTTLIEDKGQLLGFLSSGLAPVLAIKSLNGMGHAVCSVGVKRGDVQPRSDPKLHYRDQATSVLGTYTHDDRLGPYAFADLLPWTVGGRISTALMIKWPDKTPVPDEIWLLKALIVPVPLKLRLTIGRLRALGFNVAEALGQMLIEFPDGVILNCRFELSNSYRSRAFDFKLSDGGAHALMCEVTLPRYVGLIEISVPDGPLLDVLLDSTETRANPATLACVRRERLPARIASQVAALAKALGARLIA